jgi:hypothetical protein
VSADGSFIPYYAHGKRVSINLHQLLLIIELDTPLFNSQLYLLLEHIAFSGMVQLGVVPLAPLLLFQLPKGWQDVVGW